MIKRHEKVDASNRRQLCKKQGCQKSVDNKWGLCLVHRNELRQKCLNPDCDKKLLPPQVVCFRHKKWYEMRDL